MLYHRGQMLLCDPGAMAYTAETFGKDRYRFPVMSSYGHSMPVVDRQFQLPGKAARGKVLSTSFSNLTDRITMDLRSCYLRRPGSTAWSGNGPISADFSPEFEGVSNSGNLPVFSPICAGLWADGPGGLARNLPEEWEGWREIFFSLE